jgi:hypothetical protein
MLGAPNITNRDSRATQTLSDPFKHSRERICRCADTIYSVAASEFIEWGSFDPPFGQTGYRVSTSQIGLDSEFQR